MFSSDDMVTEGLPEGWCIMRHWVMVGQSADPLWQSYRWGSWNERRGLLQRKERVTGWRKVGPAARFPEVVIDFAYRMEEEFSSEAKHGARP